MSERCLCPVRALKFYLNRMSTLRGCHGYLFCSIKSPSRCLSKNAISFYLKSVILEAHKMFSPNDEVLCKVKAHDVRAMATSLAFVKNVSVKNILEAANWRSKSVFADVYLKNICLKYNDIYSLGPLVTAQAVTI